MRLYTMNHTYRGVAGGGEQVVLPPRAAESRGRQNKDFSRGGIDFLRSTNCTLSSQVNGNSTKNYDLTGSKVLVGQFKESSHSIRYN